MSHEKTQEMIVSRSCVASCEVEGRVRFGDATLPLQDHIKILEVNVDRELRFDLHLQTVARQASHRVSALCRVAAPTDLHREDCPTVESFHRGHT